MTRATHRLGPHAATWWAPAFLRFSILLPTVSGFMGIGTSMPIFANHQTPGLSHALTDAAPKALHLLPMCTSSPGLLSLRNLLTWGACASHAAVPDADADAWVPAWRLPDLPLLWCAACCMPERSQQVFTVAIALRPTGVRRLCKCLHPSQSAAKAMQHAMIMNMATLAGHGSQVADYSGDETDGLNETLCPCDFKHVSSDLISRLLAACCICTPPF